MAPSAIDTAANAQYAAFTVATGYTTDAERLGSSFVFHQLLVPAARHHVLGRVAGAPWWLGVAGAAWHAPEGPGSHGDDRPDHPVVHISHADGSLGRVLDAMDEYGLWDDTLLIVCTDHGFLLGEKGWWAKVVQPWYHELVHTSLFVHDPRRPEAAGSRYDGLVQTIDLAPTLLEFFGVPPTPDTQGRPLGEAPTGQPPRESALFGMFGGHVNVTDGRYVYLRACHDDTNQPL